MLVGLVVGSRGHAIDWGGGGGTDEVSDPPLNGAREPVGPESAVVKTGSELATEADSQAVEGSTEMTAGCPVRPASAAVSEAHLSIVVGSVSEVLLLSKTVQGHAAT